MTIKHSFVSAKADPDDTTLVKPSDWNAEHVDSQSVMAYGVVGDGITDDTDAIQYAIDSSGGGMLWFPAGEYLFSYLTIPQPLDICGAGARRTILKTSATSGAAIETVGSVLDTAADPWSVTRHKFSGFSLISNGGTEDVAYGLKFTGGGFTPHVYPGVLSLEDIDVGGLGSDGAVGVYLEDMSFVDARNVFLYGTDIALQIRSTYAGTGVMNFHSSTFSGHSAGVVIDGVQTDMAATPEVDSVAFIGCGFLGVDACEILGEPTGVAQFCNITHTGCHYESQATGTTDTGIIQIIGADGSANSGGNGALWDHCLLGAGSYQHAFEFVGTNIQVTGMEVAGCTICAVPYTHHVFKGISGNHFHNCVYHFGGLLYSTPEDTFDAEPWDTYGGGWVSFGGPYDELYEMRQALKIGGKRHISLVEKPRAGWWDYPFAVGDICWNTAPGTGDFIGWVCTAAGSPGTWLGFGAVE